MVTIAEETFGFVKKIKFSWTSGTDGTATGQTAKAYNGEIIGLVTVPDGVAAPTDQYDITVTDEDDVDVLAGNGANRATAITEYVQGSALGWVANDKLTLNIANAGDTKSGTVYLYIR